MEHLDGPLFDTEFSNLSDFFRQSFNRFIRICENMIHYLVINVMLLNIFAFVRNSEIDEIANLAAQ